jgi:hypothetical protein
MTSQELATKGKTVVEMAKAIANKEPLPDWVLIEYARAVSDAYLFLQSIAKAQDLQKVPRG